MEKKGSHGDGEEEEEVVILNPKTKMFNIFLLGLCFCFVFTGFNTLSQTQNLIYDGAESYVDNFNVNGLVTNGIIYGCLGFASWISPSIVVALGSRVAMILAATTYLFYMANFFIMMPWLIYVANVILGIGAAVIWTAQGNVLANNSDPTTITRNSGVFWAMNMSSNFIGNTLAFLLFKDEDLISESTKNVFTTILISVSGLGTLLMFFFRPTPWAEKNKVSMIDTLKGSGKLFVTPRMALFTITLFYTGLNQAVWGGVLTSSIGFTKRLETEDFSTQSLAAISGIIVAAAEVIGGILFGFMGHLTVKRGRHPIIILGFVLSMVSYALMLINFPSDATIDETTKDAIIGVPNLGLAYTTSFLVGFSDACFNTQVIAILGGVFVEQSASAFGIFKFVQSLASAASFVYSSRIALHWQLLIIAIFDILGTAACVKVELDSRKTKASALET